MVEDVARGVVIVESLHPLTPEIFPQASRLLEHVKLQPAGTSKPLMTARPSVLYSVPMSKPT